MFSFLFNSSKLALLNGDIDLAADTIKVALVGSGYSADKDAHEFFDDVTDEVSGTGYTAGGKTLVNAALAQDNVNDRAVLSADDLTWPLATLTTRAAVVYKSTGNPATSPLIAYLDFGADETVNGEDFTIVWHQDGVLYLGE